MSKARELSVLVDGVNLLNGELGIGTENPLGKLHVSDATTSGGLDTVVVFQGGVQQVVGSGAAIFLTSSSATTRGAQIAAINTTGAGQGHDLVFYTNGSTATPAERMRISSSGDMLLGTAAPVLDSAGTLGTQITGSGLIYTGKNSTLARTHYSFWNPNGQVGSISTSGTATAYNTSSDYRLKDDVSPMTGALEKVGRLNPVTYRWKTDGSAGEGFIAHELQAVFPAAVTGEKDAVDAEGRPVYQGVDVSFLVATLTAAVQELKAELDSAKSRIAALEALSQH